MVDFKLVIGTRTGKCYQKELKDADALIGKKIGDTFTGDAYGLAGYEFQITGGSDHCGFPMRSDVIGAARKRILAVKGKGLKAIGKGIRQRKTVCGNTIHAKTVQINAKALKEGKEPLAPPEAEAAAPAKETKAK